MRKKKKLLTTTTVTVGCIILLLFSTAINGFEKNYEIQPQVSIPEYRTDAARAIDAYERLMDRFLTLNEQSMGSVAVDVKAIVNKLDKIDHKLSGLSERLAKIENKLGPKQTQQSCTKKPDHLKLQKTEKPAQGNNIE